MTLFQIIRGEMRYQLKSVVFWIVLIVTFLFFHGQFGSDVGDTIQPPRMAGAADGRSLYYGSTMDLTPEEEMRVLEGWLFMDLQSEGYERYGLLTKRIKFRPAQKVVMEEFRDLLQSGRLTYEEYREEANKLDRILGGNTIYGPRFQFLLHRPMTYEEALAEYETMVNSEGVTNAYGRLFADYLGIAAGLFPAFLAAFLLGRDRRTRMDELIRAKGIHPYTYVFGKYLAVVFLLGGAYLLMALPPTWQFYRLSLSGDWAFHWWGFFRYALFWVVPAMLFTVAMTMTVAELAGNGLLALAVQLILWYMSIATLMGDYSLGKYIIRFNSAGMYGLLQHSARAIMLNRIFYVLLSFGLIALCSLIWHWKGNRGKGGCYGLQRLFQNRQVQRQDPL